MAYEFHEDEVARLIRQTATFAAHASLGAGPISDDGRVVVFPWMNLWNSFSTARDYESKRLGPSEDSDRVGGIE
jgi:hypothetical protein